MAQSVQMPELGESVTEGTITRWLKSEGDTVEVDEPLVEVSTDKVDTEIPSPAAGVLQRIVAQVDDTVEVGAELAVIGDSGQPTQQAQPAPPEQQQPQPAPQQAPQPEQQAPQPDGQVAAPQPPQESRQGGATQGEPVRMPELGESVTEGTITRWLKRVGDTVEVDEPLVEISTDKVDTEIPSPVAGTLLEITANEDDTVEVGGQLAVIGSGEAAAAPQQPAPQPAPAPQPEPQAQQTPQQPAPQAPQQQPAPTQPAPSVARHAAPEAAGNGEAGSPPYVTPLVRKLASEHGIDLSSVTGSGVGGRIRKQDVLAAVEARQAASAPAPAQAAPAAPAAPAQPSPQLAALRGTTQKASRIRQTIAKRTRESLASSAQLTQVFEVDVTKVAQLRNRAKAGFESREGVKLTFLPFFAKATVEALKQHPNINSYLDEEKKEITYFDSEHLAVAVDTERGLVSPVIHNAGDLSLAGLARKIADLADRTRSNKILPDELSGGTFTITNLGSQGALFDTPIINQPQSGILGVGRVVKRPVVVAGPDGEDTIAIRSMAYLALTYDHRLIDGADAGRFLTTIKNRLEEGSFESALSL